jgi:hypothetical protein
VPGERNNLSRDNLLNSSDNLASDEGGSSSRCDLVDSSEIVLIEKPAALSKPTASVATRDTITYETEKDIKKHSSPSPSTPLLFANNVQSYQQSQPINEQLQQKSTPVQFRDFYDDATVNEPLESVAVDGAKRDFMAISITEDVKDETSSSSMHTNPFFNSIGTTAIEMSGSKETARGELKSEETALNVVTVEFVL